MTAARVFPRILNVASLPADLDRARAAYVGPPGRRPPAGVDVFPAYAPRFSRRSSAHSPKKCGARARVRRYDRRLRAMPRLRGEIRRDLRGKDLICVCAPGPCHATVLRKIANRG